MSGLAEWLAGVSPQPPKQAEEAPVGLVSPRRKAMRRAAKLMFFSGVLFAIFLVISLAVEHPAPMLVPFFVFFISLVWMLYARLFMDNTVPMLNRSFQTSTLGAPPARTPLPAATTPPIPNTGRQRIRTNELAQPPSITEHTTRLLDNE
jgi:hypothetical protein